MHEVSARIKRDQHAIRDNSTQTSAGDQINRPAALSAPTDLRRGRDPSALNLDKDHKN